MSEGAFTRRSAVALAVAAGLSLVAAGVLGVFGDVLAEPFTWGTDAWSRSALGHRVFLELLRGEGHAVHVSRHATWRKAADGAPVALLEPDVPEGAQAGPAADGGGPSLDGIARGGKRLLVVLPKRGGAQDPAHPRWLGSHELLSTRAAERIMDRLGLGGDVIRPPAVGAWRGELPAPTLKDPQLVRGARLRPLLRTDEGVLVGEAELTFPHEEDDDEDEDDEAEPVERDERPPAARAAPDDPFPSCDPERAGDCDGVARVIVVSDPDLLANHGLGQGHNAELAFAVVERLARPGEALVVDETLHGHAQQPSLARELLAFPLVLTVLQVLGTGLLLAAAALVRFGRPQPAPEGLAPGKAFLVGNTAELLRAGGHVAEAVAAYLRACREEVQARLHPPPGESPRGWLLRIEAARGRGGALAALEARVERLARRHRGGEAEAIRLARDIHRWREELTDGVE